MDGLKYLSDSLTWIVPSTLRCSIVLELEILSALSFCLSVSFPSISLPAILLRGIHNIVVTWLYRNMLYFRHAIIRGLEYCLPVRSINSRTSTPLPLSSAIFLPPPLFFPLNHPSLLWVSFSFHIYPYILFHSTPCYDLLPHWICCWYIRWHPVSWRKVQSQLVSLQALPLQIGTIWQNDMLMVINELE